MTPTNTEPQADQASPRYLQRIDLRTALIVAGVFNAILGAAFALVGFIVIGVAAQRGFLEQINSAAADLSTGRPLHLSAFRLCLVWFVIVVGWTVAMTILAGLAAVIFNTVLRTFGGVELSLTETRGAAPDVQLHAARLRRRFAAMSRRGAVGARRGAVVARRGAASAWQGGVKGARIAGRWTATAATKAAERIPTPMVTETGVTPGRAPVRTSAPAADALKAVENQTSRERPTTTKSH